MPRTRQSRLSEEVEILGERRRSLPARSKAEKSSARNHKSDDERFETDVSAWHHHKEIALVRIFAGSYMHPGRDVRCSREMPRRVDSRDSDARE